MALPQAMAGQSRLDAFEVEGPRRLVPLARDRALAALEIECLRLEVEFADFDIPDNAVVVGMKLARLLDYTTWCWFRDFCAMALSLCRIDGLIYCAAPLLLGAPLSCLTFLLNSLMVKLSGSLMKSSQILLWFTYFPDVVAFRPS